MHSPIAYIIYPSQRDNKSENFYYNLLINGKLEPLYKDITHRGLCSKLLIEVTDQPSSMTCGPFY